MLRLGRCLNASEVGTGKTVESAAVLDTLFSKGYAKRALILAPQIDVLFQWERILSDMTDLSIAVLDGTPPERKKILQSEPPVIITNFAKLMTVDWDPIRFIDWDVVIVDECQRGLADYRTKTNRRVRALPARFKYGLSASPILNKAEDLYNIMYWIDKRILGPWPDFERRYIIRGRFKEIKAYRNMHELHRRVSDYIIRRTFDDIEDQRPELTEEVRLVELRRDEMDIYNYCARELAAQIRTALKKCQSRKVLWRTEGPIFRAYVAARQACVDCRLLADTGSQFKVNVPSDTLSQPGSKAKYLEKLLASGLTKEGDCGILCFSRFAGVLPLLAEKFGGLEYHGQMPKKKRTANLQKFREEGGILFSSDAGEVGLDLPGARYVIHFDPAWHPSGSYQRTGRIRRASSKYKHVHAIHLIAAGTVEEYIMRRSFKKGKVSEGILDGGVDSVDFDSSLLRFLERRG